MSKSVLVVGAVLLDVVGTAGIGQESSEDKIGNVSLGIGGVAFNIAVNLTNIGHDVEFFTCLKSGSPISRIIKDSLVSSGIGIKYILERDYISEAMFIQLKEPASGGGPDREFGVLTSSPIEEVALTVDDGLLEAISAAEMVIADTNLSSGQISLIKDLCRRCSRRFCIVSASDAKSARIIEASSVENGYHLVSMNEREAEKIGIVSVSGITISLPTSLVTADIVVVSRGERGALIHRRGEEFWKSIPAPDMRGRKVNPTGAGDALFSAICSCVILGKEPTAREEIQKILETVSRILRSSGANLSPVAPRIVETKGASVLLSVAVLLSGFAFLILGLSPAGVHALWVHWPSALATAAAFGGVGASVRPVLANTLRAGEAKEEAPASNWTIFMGVMIGLLAAIVGSIPTIAEVIEGDSLSKTSMYVHVILCMIIGSVSGLSLSETGRRLVKRSVAQ